MAEQFNPLTGQFEEGALSERMPPGQFDIAIEASRSIEPERAVRVFKAREATSLPRDVVDSNLEEIEKAVETQGFDAERFRRESPRVAEWMAEDPHHAALIRDETGLWGDFERFTTAIGESWKNEWDARERNALVMREFNGETLSPSDAARRDKLFGDIKYRAERSLSETDPEYFARVNTAGVFQMGQSMKESIKGASAAASVLGVAAALTTPPLTWPATVPAAMALGGTAGSLYSGAVHSYNQEAPNIFDDLRNLTDVNGVKVNVNDARNVAKVTAALVAAVEVASGAAVASAIPGVNNIIGKALGRDLAKQALVNQVKLAMTRPTTAAAVRAAAVAFVAGPTTEGLEEFVQALIAAGGREVTQAISGQTFESDSGQRDLAGAKQQMQDAFVGSIFAMGAPMSSMRLYTGMRDANQAKKNEAYYAALGETVKNSKAHQMLPTKMREVVERITANGPVQEVYVDASQWRTYFQNKGIDPQAAAREVFGNTVEYDQAVSQDSQIRIPITDYATKIAPTEHNTFFAAEIRQAPDAMNAREAGEYHKQAEQAVKDGMDVEKTVREEVSKRLVAAGYEQSTADYTAAQMGAFFKTQADRLGVSDPVALLNRYGVDIKRSNELTPEADGGTMSYRQGENNEYDLDFTAPDTAPRTVSGGAVRSGFSEATQVRTVAPDGRSVPKQVFRTATTVLTPEHFKSEALGFASGYAPSAMGVFFSDKYSYVAAHNEKVGGTISNFYLDLRKPFKTTPDFIHNITREGMDEVQQYEAFKKFVEGLKKEGHDGVMIEAPGRTDYAVFGPESVIPIERGKVYFQKKSAYLAETLGEKLVTAYTNDRGADSDISVAGENVGAREIVNFISVNVPSQYLDWATRQYVKGVYSLEDLGNVREVLEGFGRIKPGLQNKDIGQFKTLSDLRALVRKIEGDERENMAKHEVQARAETEFVFKGNGFEVVSPKTKLASQYWGQGTDWCTATTGNRNNLFDKYNDEGKLYIVITGKGEKYQFHFETDQFMDQEGMPLIGGDMAGAMESLVHEYPDLKVVFGDMAKEHYFFPLMRQEDVGDEKVQLQAIKYYISKSYDAPLGGLQGAPDNVIIGIIKASPTLVVENLVDLISLSEEAQLAAVKVSPYVIESLDSPSDNVMNAAEEAFAAIKQQGENREYQQVTRKNPFPDSKVQQVVYHGTNVEFDKFDFGKSGQNHDIGGGIYFSNKLNVAEEFAFRRDLGPSRVVSAYINLTKPYVIRDSEGDYEGGSEGAIQMVDDFMGGDFSEEDVAKLRSEGHDGVISIKGAHKVYVVFGEGQIVSAFTGEMMQKGGDTERGRISISPDGKTKITLTENADLSTFLHESGHLYLEVLRDVTSESGFEKLKQFLGYELENGPQRAQLKADAATIAQWLGAENLDNLTVDQHEQFARGIEAYLMEGVSPSAELRPVFARIRAWLVALYKTVGGLGVRLNPEVRAVFDRMFATDEAIAAAKAEAQVIPVFATAEEAGMSDIEFAAYSKLLADASEKARMDLQQKIMRQMRREQEAEWKRRRNEIRDEVAERVSSERVYSVLDKLAGDEKLSRDALYAAYPEPYKNNLVLQALHGLDVYRSKNGLDPAAVAEANGYTSVDEMIKELVAAKPYKDVVEAETEAIMKERYGDILVDGTMAEEAMKQVLGPGRSEVLEAELRALRRRQREARPIVSAVVREQQAARRTGMDALTAGMPTLSIIRQAAQDTIAQMRVRSLNAQVYLVASRTASKAALAAVHKGDYGIAAYHKQKELLNVELYREAVRVREEADNIVKFMRKFEESGTRERLGRAGDQYLEQIDAILERFDFSHMTTKDAAKRKALGEWIKDRQEAGQQVSLPDEMINEAYRKPWKEMSFDELVGVSDAARHIKHLATLKNKLLKSKADRELSATVSLIDETIAINARHGDTRQRETRLPQDALGQAFAGFLAAHRKIASLAREMDGFEDGGPVWESVIWPLNEAASTEAMMHEVSNARLHGLFKPYTTVGDQLKTLTSAASLGNYQIGIYKKEFIPEINDSLSKVGRLMVAMNWGNESNRSRIMEGYGWTTQQVEAILSPLTKEDWDFVQGVLDHFESFWPQVEALAKRVDGIAPKKVEASPIMTPFGVYRGGYFPAKYDERQSPRAFANLAKEAADRATHGAAVRAVTAHGERINRLTNVKMPVRLDFGVINEALNETIHDITHYETLIDLNRIIGNPRVQSSMVAHYGHEVYQQFRSALRDIAGGDIPAQTMVDKSLNHLRKGTTIVGMGWNLVTGALQPLGLTQSMVRIGPTYVARGLARWLGDAARMEKTTKWIYEKSAMMQERSITQSREINEIRNQVSPTGVVGPITDSYFYFIVKMQQVVDIPTWLGAYEKGMEQFGGNEAKAIATADQAVLDSQGGGQIKDRAALQRGGPAQMLWTNFYSYFNTTFNQTAESYRKTYFKNPYEVGRFAVDMLLLYTIPATLSMFIRDGLRGDVEDDPEKLLKKLAQQNLSYMMGPVMLLREMTGAAQGYYGYEGPAGAQFFAQSAKLVKQIEQGQADEAAFKAANKVMGTLFHYPAGQVQRVVEGLAYDIENGTPNPLPPLVGPPKE